MLSGAVLHASQVGGECVISPRQKSDHTSEAAAEGSLERFTGLSTTLASSIKLGKRDAVSRIREADCVHLAKTGRMAKTWFDAVRANLTFVDSLDLLQAFRQSCK